MNVGRGGGSSIDSQEQRPSKGSTKCFQISESEAVFGTTSRITGGYLKAGSSFLKRGVTGRIFRMSK